MAKPIERSIQEPIREKLTWQEVWNGPDKGVIFCWEKGRRERLERPDDAARAQNGELIDLDWRGSVTRKLKADEKAGSFFYLATWQGIRGEDLNIDLEAETSLTCTRFGQRVVFSAKLPEED